MQQAQNAKKAAAKSQRYFPLGHDKEMSEKNNEQGKES